MRVLSKVYKIEINVLNLAVGGRKTGDGYVHTLLGYSWAEIALIIA